MKKQRLIYNNDGTDILHNKRHGGRPLTPGDVEDYVDAVADTQVTSFFFYTTDDRVEGVTGEGPSLLAHGTGEF
jgi:hypothetical protein